MAVFNAGGVCEFLSGLGYGNALFGIRMAARPVFAQQWWLQWALCADSQDSGCHTVALAVTVGNQNVSFGPPGCMTVAAVNWVRQFLGYWPVWIALKIVIAAAGWTSALWMLCICTSSGSSRLSKLEKKIRKYGTHLSISQLPPIWPEIPW